MNHKKIFIFAILGVSSMLASAQSEPPPVRPAPEVGTLDAAWKPVKMDHYLGLRFGIGSGSARFEPRISKVSKSGMSSFGLSYRFDAIEQLYVGTIEVDLNYITKGFAYETYSGSGLAYSREYDIIELPIIWQPYLPLSTKNPANRIYLNVGPYLGYALQSSYRKYDTTTDLTIESGDYLYNSARDNRFEYGLVLGAGFQIAFDRLTVGVDFRYNVMLSDVMKTPTDYPSNTFFRSPVDHTSFSLAVGYAVFRNSTRE